MFMKFVSIYQLTLSTMCESGGIHMSYLKEAKRRLSTKYLPKFPKEVHWD